MSLVYTVLKPIFQLLALVWGYIVKAFLFLAGSSKSRSSRNSSHGRISLGDDDDGSTLPLAISSSRSPSRSPSPAPTPLLTPLSLSFSPPTTRTIVASPRLFEIYQANRISLGSLEYAGSSGPPKTGNRHSLQVDYSPSDQPKRASLVLARTARRSQVIEDSRYSDASPTGSILSQKPGNRSRHRGQVFDLGFDPFDPANAHLDFSSRSSIISTTPPTPRVLPDSPLVESPPRNRQSRRLSSVQGKGLAIEFNDNKAAHIVTHAGKADKEKKEAQLEAKSINVDAPTLVISIEPGDPARNGTIPTLSTTPASNTPIIEQVESLGDKGLKPVIIPSEEGQTMHPESGLNVPASDTSAPVTTSPTKSNEIGDLAKRRGFKGAPLSTSPRRRSYLLGLSEALKSATTNAPNSASVSSSSASLPAPQSAPIIENSKRSSSYFTLVTTNASSASVPQPPASAPATKNIIGYRANNSLPPGQIPVCKTAGIPRRNMSNPGLTRKFFKNASFSSLSISTNPYTLALSSNPAGSRSPSPSPSPSPRSPLASMAANLLSSGSAKPKEGSVGDTLVSDELQDLYTAADPFAPHTESFYVPNEMFDCEEGESTPDGCDDIQTIAEDETTTNKAECKANLYDFSFYAEIGNPKPRRRSIKNSGEGTGTDADKATPQEVPSIRTSGVMKMKTTIYATYDEIAYGPECPSNLRKDSRKLVGKASQSTLGSTTTTESRARGETVTSITSSAASSTGVSGRESESRSASLTSRPDHWAEHPTNHEQPPGDGKNAEEVTPEPQSKDIELVSLDTPKQIGTTVSSDEGDKDTLKRSDLKIIFTPPSVPGSPKSRHSRSSTNTITGKSGLSPTAPEPIQEIEEEPIKVKEPAPEEVAPKHCVVPQTPSPRKKGKGNARDRSQSRSRSRSRGYSEGAKDDPSEVVAPILASKQDDSEVERHNQAHRNFSKPRLNRHARAASPSPTRSPSASNTAGRSPSRPPRFKSRSRSRSRGPDAIDGGRDGTPQNNRTHAMAQSPKGRVATISPPPQMMASRPLATSTPPPSIQAPSRTWHIPRSPALSSLHYAASPSPGQNNDSKLKQAYISAVAAFDMGNTSIGSTASTISTGTGGGGGLKRTTSRFGGGNHRKQGQQPVRAPIDTTRGPVADVYYEDTLFDSYYTSEMASPVLKRRPGTLTPRAMVGDHDDGMSTSVLPPSPVMEKNVLGALGLTEPSPERGPGRDREPSPSPLPQAASAPSKLRLDLGSSKVFISERVKKGHKSLKEKWSNSSLRREMQKSLKGGDVNVQGHEVPVPDRANSTKKPTQTKSMPVLYIGTIPMPGPLPVNNSFKTCLENVDEVGKIGMFEEDEEEPVIMGERKLKLVVVNRTSETPRSSLSSQSQYPEEGEDPFVGPAPEVFRRTSGSRFAEVPAGSRPSSQYSGTGSTSESSFAYRVRERTYYEEDEEAYLEYGGSTRMDPFERLGMAILDEELEEGDSDGIDDILMRTGRG